MAEPLIPKDYFRVAETELLSGIATAYYNRKLNKLLFIANGKVIGRLAPDELEVFGNVLRDIIDMKGNYGNI
jgi:hypothetical protein